MGSNLMEQQLFEILLLFSFYCILGWITEVFGFALNGAGYQNRGICRGPYLLSYGTGAVAVLYADEYIRENVELGDFPEIAAVFLLGAAAGLTLGLLSKGIIDGISGAKLVCLKWYQPLLCGFGAVIMIFHLNPVLTAFISWMTPWVHMIFLLVFWMRFLPEIIDGIYALWKYRKKNRHILKNQE